MRTSPVDEAASVANAEVTSLYTEVTRLSSELSRPGELAMGDASLAAIGVGSSAARAILLFCSMFTALRSSNLTSLAGVGECVDVSISERKSLGLVEVKDDRLGRAVGVAEFMGAKNDLSSTSGYNESDRR